MRDIEEAVTLVESGNVSEGLRRLELAEASADDEEKYEIATLYHEWGHVQKAKAIIEELLMRYPNESDLVFLFAELLMDTNEEDRAIDILSGIEEESEERPRALLLLADIYTKQGLDEVAEQKLLEAKWLVPDEPVIAFALGKFYFSLGNDVKSAQYFKEVLDEGGDIPGENVELHLAKALSGSGRFEEALSYFEKGTADSRDAEGWFSFGLTAYRAGEYEKAIYALNELKQIDPDYGKLYVYLAKAYRAEGAVPEALRAAEDGLRIDSSNDELTFEAGLSAMKQNNVAAAETYFRETLHIHPTHHGALRSLAGLYLREDRFEDVIALLANKTDSEVYDPVFSWYLATALYAEERYEEAHAAYEQAYKGLDDDPAFLEEFGDFLLEEGRRKEAVALFKKAVSVDPSLIHLEEKILHFEE